MKVLLVHGNLEAGGGAEIYAKAVAKCVVQLGHEIAVMDINGVRDEQVGQQTPLIFRFFRLFPCLRDRHLLTYSVVCRRVPRIVQSFDRVIFTYGEGPQVQAPSLQFMHAPSLFDVDTTLQQYLGKADWRRKIYTHLCRLIAGPVSSIGLNRQTITNSNWTGAQIKAHFGVTAPVVYPSVVPLPKMPNERRHSLQFLALGRIAKNKNLDQAIDIIKSLRDADLPARLLIVGNADTNFAKRFCRTHGNLEFVKFLTNASQSTVSRALATSQFGIHCYKNEHFGIAVAEMIQEGCLPLVFDGGGVTELVTNARLRFRSSKDAVEKILDLNCKTTNELKTISNALRSSEALKRACAFDIIIARALRDFLNENADRHVA